MDVAGLVPSDLDVDGVVEMLLDATQKFAEPLTADPNRARDHRPQKGTLDVTPRLPWFLACLD